MKLKIILFGLLFSIMGWGQVTIYTENFAAGTVLPTGWTSSNTANGWSVSTASASGVYTGASSNSNVFFNGAGTNGVSHTLTYANNLSTIGFTNITVLWGARSTPTFSSPITFQWSSDGVTWNNVAFTNVAANATWALVNSGLRISLPAAAEGVDNLRFRWTSTSTNSGNHRIDDFTVQGTCTPLSLATVNPASGPIGTEVTITATSGLSGATAAFNGVAATVISNSATKLVVKVPVGASTGNLTVKTASNCPFTTPFTVIVNDVTSCQSVITDLIIYEVHDEFAGSGGTITFYNGTSSSINLSNYRLYRRGTYGSGAAATNYATLTGTIAPGTLGVIQVAGGVNSCVSPVSTNGSVTGGFNEDDELSLRNSNGTTVIDEVRTAAGAGFYMVRNSGAFAARTTYNASDWSITPLAAGACATRLGTLPATTSLSPAVNTQPAVSLSCMSTNAALNVVATEAFSGGNSLAYQWYSNAPGTASWTALTNSGVYSGVTTNALNISSLTGLNGYQFYCQVRENTATCYTATSSVKIDISATTWDGTTWSNGAPTKFKAAIINENYSTATNGSFSVCSLTVNPTYTLTISPSTYVEIENDLTNNGTVDVQNNGSLVQVSNSGVNTGDISVKREASQRVFDYVFWSSPVKNFDLNYFTTTGGTNYIYQWNTTGSNPNGGEGRWDNASGNMNSGKGYIVRGNNSFSNAAPSTWTANFSGVPNNGIITVPVTRGNDYTGLGTQGIARTIYDDNWNLVGNPYPSAIGVKEFLTTNTNIDGGVRIWTHSLLPTNSVDPFYQHYQYNYYASDYITVNPVGATSGPGDYKIGAGQGFFVMLDNAAPANGTVIFNNAMRSTGFANNQFYRQGTSNTRETSEGRIWIDFISGTETTRMLVGYVEGATYGKDRILDAITDYKNPQNFYSLINNEPMSIQGRPIPFDVNDQVPLGIKAAANGNYTIGVAAIDGLFAVRNQKIYLEDKLLNTTHEISQSPYQFSTNNGIINDRFVLRFTNQTLSANNFELENSVKVYGTENSIVVKSTIENIKEVTIYNVLGQKLTEKNKTQLEIEISSIKKSNETLIAKVLLENGETIIKKIIF
ncbi:MAG: T9SS sorting signal type C domain-containing protein [Limnohabitans sp.]|nr:T9SS sorting signal type C domain-containing protein [Limnohabitans sp.]